MAVYPVLLCRLWSSLAARDGVLSVHISPTLPCGRPKQRQFGYVVFGSFSHLFDQSLDSTRTHHQRSAARRRHAAHGRRDPARTGVDQSAARARAEPPRYSLRVSCLLSVVLRWTNAVAAGYKAPAIENLGITQVRMNDSHSDCCFFFRFILSQLCVLYCIWLHAFLGRL